MLQILNVVSDRGSRYAVSGGPVRCRADIDAFREMHRAAARRALAAGFDIVYNGEVVFSNGLFKAMYESKPTISEAYSLVSL